MSGIMRNGERRITREGPLRIKRKFNSLEVERKDQKTIGELNEGS
jgi:hypothetical protein